MIEVDRLITPVAESNEQVVDRAIRPKSLTDYVGQPVVCEQMDIFLAAAGVCAIAGKHVVKKSCRKRTNLASKVGAPITPLP